jgi:hypothetical protein
MKRDRFFLCMFRQKRYDRWGTHDISLRYNVHRLANYIFWDAGCPAGAALAEQISDLRLGVGREQIEGLRLRAARLSIIIIG